MIFSVREFFFVLAAALSRLPVSFSWWRTFPLHALGSRLFIAVLSLAAFAGFLGLYYVFGPGPSRVSAERLEEGIPCAVAETDRVGSPEYNFLLKQGEGVRLKVSDVLHLMMLFGCDATTESESLPPVRLIDIISSDIVARDYLSSASMVKTRWGVRFIPPVNTPNARSGGESHRDQVLAVLGGFGLPLSHRLLLDGRAYSLRDSFVDLIANFDLDQPELPWTTVALLTYRRSLTAGYTWKNRFGRKYTFSDVAYELMKRPIHQSGCGGMHHLSCLVAIHNVAQLDRTLVTPDCGSQLREYLAAWADAIRSSQDSDGTWSPSWWAKAGTEPDGGVWQHEPVTVSNKLLVTGHLLELIRDLPAELRPGKESCLLAARWLHSTLDNASPDAIKVNLCPNVHAIRSLAWLRSVANGDRSF